MSWIEPARAQAEVALLVRKHLDITITEEHITQAQALAVTIIGAQVEPIAEPIIRPFSFTCLRVAAGHQTITSRNARRLRAGVAKTDEMLAHGWVRIEGEHSLFPDGGDL